MRTLSLLSVIGLSLGCTPETFSSFEAGSGEPAGIRELLEQSHEVHLRQERGEARLTVTRLIRNLGASHAWADQRLAVPHGAAAKTLRVSAGGQSAEAELLRSESAISRWEELLSMGEAVPQPVALLELEPGGGLSLSLFGIAPGGTAAVQYELVAPLEYADGEWRLDYPLDDEQDWSLAKPTFPSLASSWRVEEVPEEENPDEPCLPCSPRAMRLSSARWGMAMVEARWATFAPGPERAIWRLEVDAAKVLEPTPARPNVAFVIDASCSEGPEGIAAQLELLPGYLANAPDARVEVVLFRRRAERLFGRLVPAGEVAALLAALPPERLAPGNGSNLDLGAAEAALALEGEGGVSRIVLLTDGMLKEALQAPELVAALAKAPKGTVVHAVLRDGLDRESELSEERLEEETLAPVAEAYGGVALQVSGRAAGQEPLAAAMLGLVRPFRIDALSVEAPGMENDEIEVDRILREGGSLRLTALAERPPQRVMLRGKVWARKLELPLYGGGDLADRLPALAIGLDEVRGQLRDSEEEAAAWSARVVSSATSLLATAPTAAPSLAGSDTFNLGSITGSSCCGWGVGCRGVGWGAGHRVDWERLRVLLAGGIAACARAHGLAGLSTSLRIELTGFEVVDVRALSAPSPELASCVEESAWGLDLRRAGFSAFGSRELSLEVNATGATGAYVDSPVGR
ncbi:MAG: VWA domain-containing protein [Myxococcales bacterium]|nr:VWA domain-containing protein [Myxococcales bacterium]